MQIGGFQKLSLIDYPGKVAAVIFTQGCNFRCPFCHNRDLVLPQYYKPTLSEEEVYDFLKERRDKLQGVVVTGGEPTLQPDFIPFLKKLKQFGYSVKIDTNGSQPEVLEKIIQAGLVDYIAMDIKAPLESYAQAAGVPVDINNIQKSIEFLLSSGINYHFRTTAVKPLLSLEDFKEMSALIKDAERYIIQEFIPHGTILDNSLLDRGHFTAFELNALKEQWERQEVSVSM